MVDRSNAIKSVRSLSRTIEDLIAKEKEKISEHYQSKLEKSRASNLTQSRVLSGSRIEHDIKNELAIDNDPNREGFATTGHPLPVDENGESQLKLSTLTKTTAPIQPSHVAVPQKTAGRGISPGGTTDSLQFSQSVALSNLATTMRGRVPGGQQGPTPHRKGSQASVSKERLPAAILECHDQNRALEFGDLGGVAKEPVLPGPLPVDQQELVTLQ